MALIKCPECGQSISEYADKCIYCGCPMTKVKELLQKKEIKLPEKPISKSETYSSLTDKEKSLVYDLHTFILENTSLLPIDHSKSFGFRRKNGHKMVLVFKITHKRLTIRFRNKTDLAFNSMEINTDTLEIIKSAILRNYPKTQTKTQPKSNKKETKQDNLLDNWLSKQESSTKKEVKKKAEDKLPTDNLTFTERRSDYENRIIKLFEEGLNERIKGIVPVNAKYYYAFRVKNEKESIRLCSFTNGKNNKLAFKYFVRPLQQEAEKITYPLLKDIDYLLDLINGIYQKEFVKNETIQIKYQSNEKEPAIYSLIVKAIKGKSFNGSDDLYKVSAKVADFVWTELKAKAIEQKYFNDAKEFDEFKYIYRFIPNFFGYRFSISNITTKDAKVFYGFYKAAELITIIQRYEKMFNTTIIDNYQSCLDSFKRIIDDKENSYSSAKGINSNFRYVPDGLLIETVDRLNLLEEIY